MNTFEAKLGANWIKRSSFFLSNDIVDLNEVDHLKVYSILMHVISAKGPDLALQPIRRTNICLP